MGAILGFLDLAGSVALLLWGVHMVQSGVERAFGPGLRRLLARAVGNRWRGFLAGLLVTGALQSSTATALMVAGFAAFIDPVPALAIMLGANIGTTLIVQALSFNIAVVAPLFVLVGLVLFRRGARSRRRDLGRAAIGLGLMLLALQQLFSLVEAYASAPSLRLLFDAIAGQPVAGAIIAAALAWAMHSSVATVLLIASFAAKGVVPLPAALALVLGANFGSALNPLFESGADPRGRRVPLGNLLNRALGLLLGLLFLGKIAPLMMAIEALPSRAVADFHTLFNLSMAGLFLPFLGPFARFLERLLPAHGPPADPSQPIYLNESALEAPAIALSAASREALRMTDALASMLDGAGRALDGSDRKSLAAVAGLDTVLDRLNGAIKAYLAALDPTMLEEGDKERLAEILAFSTNLEHAGDIVEHGLIANAGKRLKRGLAFSAEGEAEIRAMLERLRLSLRGAAAVFMTDDPRAARQLIHEKEIFRELEARASEAHFARLREGRVESLETSSLHLDMLRDLKRINAHLAAASYPVLERLGELLPSRLKQEGGAEEAPPPLETAP
jgi:phosphate:Na+ symporter